MLLQAVLHLDLSVTKAGKPLQSWVLNSPALPSSDVAISSCYFMQLCIWLLNASLLLKTKQTRKKFLFLKAYTCQNQRISFLSTITVNCSLGMWQYKPSEFLSSWTQEIGIGRQKSTNGFKKNWNLALKQTLKWDCWTGGSEKDYSQQESISLELWELSSFHKISQGNQYF